MADTWYPVIDYGRCTECGLCVSRCPHCVFDRGKAPVPVVRMPGRCIDHCHGCGNRCPAGAITYVGDDTGWTPPGRKGSAVEAPAPCGCSVQNGKEALVEFLYLDLETCDRCVATASILDEVMAVLSPALVTAGYDVEYMKTKIESPEQAERYRFLSSPTIRVNGRDICSSLKEDVCYSCGCISGEAVLCRRFTHELGDFEVPPKEVLAEAVLKAILGPATGGCSCEGGYRLPENLKAFFEGVERKKAGTNKGEGSR